jgi:hypothetical protein
MTGLIVLHNGVVKPKYRKADSVTTEVLPRPFRRSLLNLLDFPVSPTYFTQIVWHLLHNFSVWRAQSAPRIRL